MSLAESGALLALVDEGIVERAKFAHETTESFAERMLRARSNNVEMAAELIHSIAEWRHVKQPATIAQTHPDDLLGISEDELSSMYPHTYLPVTDVEGRPVYWEKTGQIDVEALVASTTLDKVLMWHIHTIEAVCVPMMAASQQATGRSVNQVTNILDCQGLALSSLNAQTREYLKMISDMDKTYYPELLGTMLVLNAPTAFYAIWSFVSAFLDPRTRSKIVVCRDNGLDEWVKIMGSLDRVPVEYGGTLVTHPDAMRGSMERTTVSSGQVMTVSKKTDVETTMIVRSLVRSSPIKVVVALSREDGEIRVVKDERWTDCDRVVKEVRVEMQQGDTVSVSWDNMSNWIGRDVMYSILPSKSRQERVVEYQEKLRRYGIEWMAASQTVDE